MSVARLYLDADSMAAVVFGLRARGIDATSAQEAGMADSTDEEHLEFARVNGRVLFSFNVSDFQRIHTQHLAHGRIHAGMVLAVQQRYSVVTEYVPWELVNGLSMPADRPKVHAAVAHIRAASEWELAPATSELFFAATSRKNRQAVVFDRLHFFPRDATAKHSSGAAPRP